MNCTKDQYVFWEQTSKLTRDDNIHLIALPGPIATLKIKGTHDDDQAKSRYITLDWIEPPPIQEYMIENVTETKFRDYPGYVEFSFVRRVEQGTFYFVKYMDLEQSEINGQLRQTAEFLFHFYGAFYKLKQEDFNCPDENQRSKTFSWIEAFLLCRSINATLPEFYSRKEQEEFITVVKSGNIFPIEAVYTGLHKGTQVCNDQFTCILRHCVLKQLFRLYSPVGILKKNLLINIVRIGKLLSKVNTFI